MFPSRFLGSICAGRLESSDCVVSGFAQCRAAVVLRRNGLMVHPRPFAERWFLRSSANSARGRLALLPASHSILPTCLDEAPQTARVGFLTIPTMIAMTNRGASYKLTMRTRERYFGSSCRSLELHSQPSFRIADETATQIGSYLVIGPMPIAPSALPITSRRISGICSDTSQTRSGGRPHFDGKALELANAKRAALTSL